MLVASSDTQQLKKTLKKRLSSSSNAEKSLDIYIVNKKKSYNLSLQILIKSKGFSILCFKMKTKLNEKWFLLSQYTYT